MVDATGTAVRTLTITVPDSVAELAETMARDQNLALDEVFQRAIHSLQFDIIGLSVDAARPESSRNTEEQSMDDVYRTIKAARRSGEERKTA